MTQRLRRLAKRSGLLDSDSSYSQAWDDITATSDHPNAATNAKLLNILRLYFNRSLTTFQLSMTELQNEIMVYSNQSLALHRDDLFNDYVDPTGQISTQPSARIWELVFQFYDSKISSSLLVDSD